MHWIWLLKTFVIVLNRILCFTLITATNSVDTTQVAVPEIVQSTYRKDIDVHKPELQLRMLPDLVSAFRKSENLTHLIITKVSTVADMLREVSMSWDVFLEVDKLLRLYLTIPVTSYTAERSFSSLRRIN